VEVSKKTTIPDPKERAEIKVKSSKTGRQGSTGKHDVKVAYDVKSVMKDNVEADVCNKHPA
jgi:hypothetical protein